jgi:Glycosyltransferase family 87
MNMERNPDEVVAARAGGVATVEQGRRLAMLAMTGLTLFLLLWNLVLLAVAFHTMPRNDFGRPLLGTQAFLQGKDMYALTDAVVYQYKRETVLHLWNLNPPHSHFLYLPLAVIPSWLALPAWCALGGLCLYGSIRIIVSEVGIELTPRRKEWIAVGLLAFTGMGAALITAHMSFLLMLLITLAWRDARHGRWGKAGSWLGVALSIKPFLLIFVPYLVLKGCWRGVAAVGLTTGLSFLLGLLVFGPESHYSWLRVLSRADSWAWLPLNASLYGTLSRVLMNNPMFTSMATLDPGLVRVAWLALGIPAGFVALLRTVTDPLSEGTDRAFGILLVSAVLLSPLGWVYYFWLPVGPIAATARGWWIERSKMVRRGSAPIGLPSGYLFLASMVGMAAPAFLSVAFQPSAMATLVYGSIHFWALALMWLALIFDRLDLRLSHARIASVCLANSPWRRIDTELVTGSP